MSEFEKRNLKSFQPVKPENISNFREQKKFNLQETTYRGLFWAGLLVCAYSSFKLVKNSQLSHGAENEVEHMESVSGKLKVQSKDKNKERYNPKFQPVAPKLELFHDARAKYCLENLQLKTQCDWVINPLGESPKILIPFIPTLEYYDVKNEQLEKSAEERAEKMEHNKLQNGETPDPRLGKDKLGNQKQASQEFEIDVKDKFILELENLGKVLFSLAKEELYTENLVIYLLMFLPKAQHYLFFILVSKARLTTFACRQTQKQVAKIDKVLNTIYQKLRNFEGKQNTNFSTNHNPVKMAKVFDEIQTLRNTLTQVKLALQAPMMMVKHGGNMTETYLGLTDLAAPRFSSIFLPKAEEVNEESVYKTIKGEKYCSLVWEESLSIFSRKFAQKKNRRDLFWLKLKVELPDKELFSSYDLPEFEYDDQTKIKNEEKIAEVQRLIGYHEYYGVENMEKLRTLFYGLETLVEKVIGSLPDYDTAIGEEVQPELELASGKKIKSLATDFYQLIYKEIGQELGIKYNPRTRRKEIKSNDWIKLTKYAFILMDREKMLETNDYDTSPELETNGQIAQTKEASSSVTKHSNYVQSQRAKLGISYIPNPDLEQADVFENVLVEVIGSSLAIGKNGKVTSNNREPLLASEDKEWLVGCAKIAQEFKLPIDIFLKAAENQSWVDNYIMPDIDLIPEVAELEELTQESNDNPDFESTETAKEQVEAAANHNPENLIKGYQEYSKLTEYIKNTSWIFDVQTVQNFRTSFFIRVNSFVETLFENDLEMKELCSSLIAKYTIASDEDFGIINWESQKAYNSSKFIQIMTRRYKALFLGLSNEIYQIYTNQTKYINSKTASSENFNLYLDRVKNRPIEKYNDYSEKMPSWTIFAPNFFNDTFVNFLHYYRARSDLSIELQSKLQARIGKFQPLGHLAPKLTLDQKVNIWVSDMPHAGLTQIPEIRNKVKEYLFEADLINYWFKADSPSPTTTPEQNLKQIREDNIF